MNLGNTCALNSILQCISYTTVPAMATDKAFSKNLFEVLELMRRNDNKVLKPRSFLDAFYSCSSMYFNRGYQIDAPELWNFICNQVSKETWCPMVPREEFENELSRQAYTQLALHNERMASAWQDWFQGSTITIIKCLECQTKTFTFEPFYELNLEPNKDIISMLQEFFSFQERQDEWRCDRCNKNTRYMKSIKLWHTPKILVICIKRYNNRMQKTLDAIKINKNISFGASSVLSSPSSSFKFNIQSIIQHHGIYGGGHYNSTIVRGDSLIHYDDCSVSTMDIERYDWTNRNAYMLFYSS